MNRNKSKQGDLSFVQPQGIALVVFLFLFVIASRSTIAEEPIVTKTEQQSNESVTSQKVIDIFNKWQQSPQVKAEITKTLKTEFLMTPRVSKGKFFASKGRLRLETTEPTSSLIVVSGGDVWQEERVDDFIQVNHASSKDLKRSSGLLALLFGDKKIWQDIIIEAGSTEGTVTQFLLKPLNAKDWPVQNLTVVVDLKTQDLKSLSFTDELDNQLTYEFSKIQFLKKINEKLFSYKPPTNAQINRF